jgi:hypothetical protein
MLELKEEEDLELSFEKNQMIVGFEFVMNDLEGLVDS